MAKQSGLGDQLYVDGRNLSGDIGSLGAIGGGNTPLEVTGIDKSAFERLGGLRDGRIEFVSFFNPDTGQAHPVLSDLPRTDRIVSYWRGTAFGGKAASLVGKQIDYNPTRGNDGSLTFAISAQANGFGLEWGESLTAGVDSFAAAGAGSGLDSGAAATNFGVQAYLHVFAFTGTSATVAIQDSDDDGAGDPYADVSGAVFDAVTSAPEAQRLQTARTQAVKRWTRINVTGTFTALDLAVKVVRNQTTVNFTAGE